MLVAVTSLVVERRDFRQDLIQLDAGNTRLRTDVDPLKTAESEQLMKILYNFDPSALWSADSFMAPVESQRRTSFFGDRRVYAYTDGSTDNSIHAGIDFGVPTGSIVQASARGRVRLARFRIVTGNSIVIEHLPGVFSLYYHLDRIDIKEGAIVEAGSTIGVSGSTGLSTGPHLHWELRVAGEAADPDAFIQSPLLRRDLLDKDALLGKIGQ
jgi:murein DD-endopeptidase MepM/ murein hydrolase activator NlpD